MNKLLPAFACFLMVLSISCSNKLLIKITNNSGEDFKQLKVNIIGHTYEFNNLKNNQNTGFFKVDSTYRYFYAQATTAKATITLQPIDFVGEKCYKSGKFDFQFRYIEDEDGIKRPVIDCKRIPL